MSQYDSANVAATMEPIVSAYAASAGRPDQERADLAQQLVSQYSVGRVDDPFKPHGDEDTGAEWFRDTAASAIGDMIGDLCHVLIHRELLWADYMYGLYMPGAICLDERGSDVFDLMKTAHALINKHIPGDADDPNGLGDQALRIAARNVRCEIIDPDGHILDPIDPVEIHEQMGISVEEGERRKALADPGPLVVGAFPLLQPGA